jgi:hypothetical protein
MSVVFVIARYVNHWLIRKLAGRPFNAAQSHTDIAGKNDNIRAGFRRREVGNFCVENSTHLKWKF